MAAVNGRSKAGASRSYDTEMIAQVRRKLNATDGDATSYSEDQHMVQSLMGLLLPEVPEAERAGLQQRFDADKEAYSVCRRGARLTLVVWDAINLIKQKHQQAAGAAVAAPGVESDEIARIRRQFAQEEGGITGSQDRALQRALLDEVARIAGATNANDRRVLRSLMEIWTTAMPSDQGRLLLRFYDALRQVGAGGVQPAPTTPVATPSASPRAEESAAVQRVRRYAEGGPATMDSHDRQAIYELAELVSVRGGNGEAVKSFLNYRDASFGTTSARGFIALWDAVRADPVQSVAQPATAPTVERTPDTEAIAAMRRYGQGGDSPSGDVQLRAKRDLRELMERRVGLAATSNNLGHVLFSTTSDTLTPGGARVLVRTWDWLNGQPGLTTTTDGSAAAPTAQPDAVAALMTLMPKVREAATDDGDALDSDEDRALALALVAVPAIRERVFGEDEDELDDAVAGLRSALAEILNDDMWGQEHYETIVTVVDGLLNPLSPEERREMQQLEARLAELKVKAGRA